MANDDFFLGECVTSLENKCYTPSKLSKTRNIVMQMLKAEKMARERRRRDKNRGGGRSAREKRGASPSIPFYQTPREVLYMCERSMRL